MAGQSASAALLFYDGFSAGGATPGTGQYVTSPASTNGLNNDSLVRSASSAADGQSPATFGFVPGTGNGWRTGDGIAATVYPKLLSTGLSYGAMATQVGSLDITRTGSNAALQLKNYSRVLAPGLGTGATDLYFSSLMQFDAGIRGQMGIIQGTVNILSFGFNDAGQVNILGNAGAILATTTGTAYSAGTTYLLVAHVYNTNMVDIYLNPADLSDISGSASQRILTGISLTGFTAGAAVVDLRLTANTGNNVSNPDFIFDEVHGATTWAEAFTVPEPGSALLAAAGGLLAFVRRRR